MFSEGTFAVPKAVTEACGREDDLLIHSAPKERCRFHFAPMCYFKKRGVGNERKNGFLERMFEIMAVILRFPKH